MEFSGLRRPWRRMAVIFLDTAFLIVAISPSTFAQSGESSHIVESHGTVNIILADGGTLVAVTDSMLTHIDPVTNEAQHLPIGTKLYKIDDRTVCAMAGLYHDEGAADVTKYAIDIPQFMRNFGNQQEARNNKSAESLAQKALQLSNDIKFELTVNLQARVVANPKLDITNVSPLELTLVGYDSDGLLKVAEITLQPAHIPSGVGFVNTDRPPSSNKPACAQNATVEQALDAASGQLAVRVAGKTLFCEIAGVPDKAEELLAHPEELPQDEVLQGFARATRESQTLSPGELRDLAIDLARQTEANEKQNGKQRVGGAPNVAMLSEGRMVEEPTDQSPATYVSKETGTALSGDQASDIAYDCGPTGKPPIDIMALRSAQLSVKHCSQTIDNVTYHDSSFIDSELTYLGARPLLFGNTNVVTGSILRLGPSVDLKREDVVHLVCGFPWKQVYQGGNLLKLACAATPSQ